RPGGTGTSAGVAETAERRRRGGLGGGPVGEDGHGRVGAAPPALGRRWRRRQFGWGDRVVAARSPGGRLCPCGNPKRRAPAVRARRRAALSGSGGARRRMGADWRIRVVLARGPPTDRRAG